MADHPPKVSGASNAAALAPLLTTKLSEQQLALTHAWAGDELAPIARNFMLAVESTVRETGRVKSLLRASVSQIPPKLAGMLVGLQTKSGLIDVTAQALLTVPSQSKEILQALVNSNALSADVQRRLGGVLDLPIADENVALMRAALSTLSAEALLLALEAVRNTAIDAMLKAWGESIRENAAKDAETAKINAAKAAQTRRVNAHNADLTRSEKAESAKQSLVSQSLLQLNPTSDAFFAQLLKQRKAVLARATELLQTNRVALSGVEQSFAHAERSQLIAARLADPVNVATLYALEFPEDDLGPKLGGSRGRP